MYTIETILIKLILLFLLPTFLWGQKGKSLTIEVLGGGNFYNSIYDKDESSWFEQPLFSPNIEISLGKEITKNLLLQGGIRYSTVLFEYSKSQYRLFDPLNTIEENEEKLTQKKESYLDNPFGELKNNR